MGSGPYGLCAVSPMYRIASCGSWSRTARATVSPPTPESKMPIGALLLGRPAPGELPMSRARLSGGTDVHMRKGPLPPAGGGPWDHRSQATLEQRLPSLGALAAVGLRLAEQLGDLRVTAPLGVLDVQLEAHRVAQAGLGVPDEVVVLVRGAGDVAGLAGHAGHDSAPGVDADRTAGAVRRSPGRRHHQCNPSAGRTPPLRRVGLRPRAG